MIRIGTSGFSFPEWEGSFYPEGTKDQLAFYARHLDTVEINYTYRRHPSSATLARWKESVSPAFAFTLKAHQQITHRHRLKDAGESAALFCNRAIELGEHLGSILFQLPPNMKADPELLASFCAVLSDSVRPKACFEFRHESWFVPEVYSLLREAGCALVLAETEETEATGEPTGRLVYVRLRKDEYPDEKLAEWATRLRALDADGHDVFCYLKHEDEAPRHAMHLRELVAH